MPTHRPAPESPARPRGGTGSHPCCAARHPASPHGHCPAARPAPPTHRSRVDRTWAHRAHCSEPVRQGCQPPQALVLPQPAHAALRQRRVSVKQALLSGELVVGAGNIYASDALFEAGMDPRTRCDRIAAARAARLLAAVQRVLAEAIAAGGSTLKDFKDAHGTVGQYQGQARVYGREGQACQRCAGTIKRIVQGQRATYFCPGCQH
ncbi:MAG: formamidopyrimidine-DNA glycosylase [Ideonella sp. MAG2]|nr:MAG: formamidopyrimidine-DNA glycosylase [Ideonella sp. MAG2]